MSRHVIPGPLNAQHVALANEDLRLEPMQEAHLPELLALFDPSIWRWYSATIASPAALEQFLRTLLAEDDAMPYAARSLETGELVGATAYLHIAKHDRRVEIGSTWWAPKWQRTFVNSTAKQLMLVHAFETMGAIAVELRTDALNSGSRRAIERLGAKYSGLLPAHRICDDGRLRDTVVYTLVESEWRTQRPRAAPPGVRHARLDDLPALGALRWELWPDEPADAHTAFARALIEGTTGATLPSAVFVAEHEGQIVGFADVALRSHGEDCDLHQAVGFLEGWFVQPEHRRKGIGRRLVDAAEAWAAHHGAIEMASNTWAGHALSMQAHASLGFEVLETIVSFKKQIKRVE